MGDKTQLLSFVLAAKLKRPWRIIRRHLPRHLATLPRRLDRAPGAGDLVSRDAEVDRPLSFFVSLCALNPDTLDGPRVQRPQRLLTRWAFFLVEMGDKTQFATVALGALRRAGAVVMAPRSAC